jgi:hypothetical protein
MVVSTSGSSCWYRSEVFEIWPFAPLVALNIHTLASQSMMPDRLVRLRQLACVQSADGHILR